MALDIGSTGKDLYFPTGGRRTPLNWLEEEKEKARQRAAQEALRHTQRQPQARLEEYGAARPASLVDEIQQVQQKAPDRRAEDAARAQMKLQMERDQQQIKGLEEYFTAARDHGGEKAFSYRLENVESLVKVYLPQYSTAGLVWDLAKSGYTEREIDSMLRESTNHMLINRGNSKPILPEKLMQALDLDPEDPKAAEKAFEYSLRFPNLTVAWMSALQEKRAEEMKIEERATWAKPYVFAFAAGALTAMTAGAFLPAAASLGVGAAGGLGSTIPIALTPSTTVGGSVVGSAIPVFGIRNLVHIGSSAVLAAGAVDVMSLDKKDEIEAFKVAAKINETEATYSAVAQTVGLYDGSVKTQIVRDLQQFHDKPVLEKALLLRHNVDQFTKNATAAEVEDYQQSALDMWRDLPEMESYVKSLEVTGVMSEDWQAAFIFAGGITTKYNISLQHAVKEANLVPTYLEVDGDMSDPLWEQGVADYMSQLAAWEELEENNPTQAWIRDLFGFAPGPGLGKRIWNGLTKNGMVSAVFWLPAAAAKHVGSVPYAAVMALDMDSRRRASPEYQSIFEKQSDLARRLAEEDSELIIGTSISAPGELMDVDRITGRWLDEQMNGPLGENSEMAALQEQRKEQERRLIAQRPEPSISFLASQLAGVDAADFERWYEKNDTLAHAIDFGAFMAGGFIPMRSLLGRNRPLTARTKSNVLANPHAREQAMKVIDLVAEGREAQAAIRMQGSPDHVQDALRRVRGDLFGVVEGTPRLTYARLRATVEIERISRNVTEAAARGDWDEVERVLTRNAVPDTQRWIKSELIPSLKDTIGRQSAIAAEGGVAGFETAPKLPIPDEASPQAALWGAKAKSQERVLKALNIEDTAANRRMAQSLIKKVDDQVQTPARKRQAVNESFDARSHRTQESINAWEQERLHAAGERLQKRTKSEVAPSKQGPFDPYEQVVAELCANERSLQQGAPSVENHVASFLAEVDSIQARAVTRRVNATKRLDEARARALAQVTTPTESDMLALVESFLGDKNTAAITKWMKQRGRGEDILFRRLNEALLARQGRYGDVLGIVGSKDRALDTLAELFGGGQNIFPHWTDPRVAPGPAITMSLSNTLVKVRNPNARHILGRFVSQFGQKPLKDIAWSQANSFDRVRSAAMAALGDAIEADFWAAEFMRTRGRPTALGRWETRFAARLDEIYVLGPSTPLKPKPGGFMSSFMDKVFYSGRAKGDFESLGSLSGGTFAVDQVSGEALGAYTVVRKDGVHKKTVISDTTGHKYTVHIPDFTLADYQNMATGLARATIATSNTARTFGRAFQRIGAFSRHITVGWGAPVLFTKHAFTDTARTIYQVGPGAVINYRRNEARVQRALDAAGVDDPAAVRMARMDRDRAIHTEAHWLDVPGASVKKESVRFFDDKGKLTTSRAESANAIRRVAQGDVFREYVRGGPEGVVAWLRGNKKGREFVRTSRAWEAAQESLPAGATQEMIREAAEREILRTSVHQYQQIKVLYPDWYGDMAKAALSGNVEADQILKNMLRRNKTKPMDQWENPALSMGVDSKATGVEGAFIEATRHAMTPNYLNRKAAWNKLFLDAMKSLDGDGMAAGNKVRVAASIATERSAQIHFDLARALQIENKYRWAVWFGTKQRLWHTALLKMAADRPLLAGGVLYFADWMEARNKDSDVPEWEKYTLRFNIGGNEMRINMPPVLWLSEYPIESQWFRLMKEYGAVGANIIRPGSVHTAPNTFAEPIDVGNMSQVMWAMVGMDRVQQTVQGMVGVVKAAHVGLFSDDATIENVRKLQEDMTEKERRYFEDQIGLRIALSGGTIGHAEAAKQVMISRLVSGALRSLKPTSWRFFTEHDIETKERIQKYYDLEGLERQEYINNNPDLALSILPHGQDIQSTVAIQQGLMGMWEINKWAYDEAMSRYQAGILRDPDEVPKFMAEVNEKIDTLKRDNPEYANFYRITSNETLESALMPFFPAISDEDAAMLRASADRNVEAELNKVRNALEEDFLAEASRRGIDHVDLYEAHTNRRKGGNMERLMTDARVHPHVKWLYYDTVVKPFDEATKKASGVVGLNYNESRVTRFLARGGEVGQAVALEFTNTMINAKKLRVWTNVGIATSGNAASVPAFAGMTSQQKEDLGWNSNPRMDAIWRLYAEDSWGIKMYMRENQIAANTREYNALMDKLKSKYEKIAADDPEGFGVEWDFCKLRLWERLEYIGVVEQSQHKSLEAKQGWVEFFDIMTVAQHQLDSIYNKSARKYGVSLKAGSAKEISNDTIRRLMALRRRNDDWYDEWSMWLDLNSFGFNSAWRIPGDADLWEKRGMTTDVIDDYLREEDEELW